MEATALHSFNPLKPDELEFKKGSTLYVINMDEEPSWYRARQDKREGLVPKNYLQMQPHSWFIPNCSRLEAEARLAEKDPGGNYIQPDGAFILRPSENNPGQFSISVKEGVFVLHFRVFFEEPGSYFIWTSKFSSINKLIEHHRGSTIYGLRNLLLKDCSRSDTFGPIGSGSPYKAPSSNGARNQGPMVFNSNNTTNMMNHNPTSKNLSARDQIGLSTDSMGKPGSGIVHMSQPVAQPSSQQQPQLPPGLQTTSRTGQICVALYDFNPEFQEEMGFVRGDRIEIIAEEDKNWWLGKILDPKTGLPRQPLTQGLFPSNYVKITEGLMAK